MSLIIDPAVAQQAQLATISTQLDAISAGGVSNAADVAVVTEVGTALTAVAVKVAALVPAPVS